MLLLSPATGCKKRHEGRKAPTTGRQFLASPDVKSFELGEEMNGAELFPFFAHPTPEKNPNEGRGTITWHIDIRDKKGAVLKILQRGEVKLDHAETEIKGAYLDADGWIGEGRESRTKVMHVHLPLRKPYSREWLEEVKKGGREEDLGNWSGAMVRIKASEDQWVMLGAGDLKGEEPGRLNVEDVPEGISCSVDRRRDFRCNVARIWIKEGEKVREVKGVSAGFRIVMG